MNDTFKSIVTALAVAVPAGLIRLAGKRYALLGIAIFGLIGGSIMGVMGAAISGVLVGLFITPMSQ